MEKFNNAMRNFVDGVSNVFHSVPMRVVGRTLAFTGKILLTIFLIGMITACIFGCILTVYVFNTFANSQDIPNLSRVLEGREISIVYVQNANGDWVEDHRIDSAEKGIWADLEDIPLDLQHAVVAIEDERFYQHDGVDWKRTGAAVVNELLGGSSFGGSTITQQLIKVATQDNEVTIERKIREIFTALEVERNHYTKDDIMEAYLNLLPLSDNVTGVGAAANYFFGKEVSELTTAECALIAGITNLPAYYDPYDHPDHAKRRQEIILDKMYELGYLTADEYRQAYNEELVYKNSARYIPVQNYYADLVVEDVIRDLQETYSYSYSYAETLVYSGGLRIYSYENKAIQEKVEALFRDDSNFPDIEGVDGLNAAIFITDYEGRVIATVGGRGQKEGNRVQNISTQARRQPGSSIKPISVYAPAVDAGIVNYSTIVPNKPLTIDGDLWPHNFGESVYAATGVRTVQVAVQQSHNTIPAQILKVMGLETSYNFLKEKLRFTSLEEGDQNYAPLALGGFTYGVTVREMAAGYQIFGNGGYYNSPHTYGKVTMDDQILLQHVPERDPVISNESATIMNRLLQKVVTQGTAYAIYDDWWQTEVFAKTGTTDDNKDSYFAGGTPYYVGAIWMGYEDNKQMTDYQRAQAKELWSKCMKVLHEGKENKKFDIWGNVRVMAYDPNSGAVSSYGTSYGYYDADNIPYGSNVLSGIDYTPPTETTLTTTGAGVTTTTGAGGKTTTTATVVTTSPPVETTEAPVETTEAPVETTEAPTETTAAPPTLPPTVPRPTNPPTLPPTVPRPTDPQPTLPPTVPRPQ